MFGRLRIARRCGLAAATFGGGLGVATFGGDCVAVCEASDTPSATDPSPTPQPSPMQWLWSTGDGVRLLRDAAGRTVFVDEATGETMSSRPETVPPEAFANRWRDPEAEPRDERRGRVARHILLVRHAQYHMSAADDAHRTLTSMGEQQTTHLAQRLRALHEASTGYHKATSFSMLSSSKLTRAVQTADAVATALTIETVGRHSDLNEGRPCLPEPAPSHAPNYTNRSGDSERIEHAGRRICARPPPSQTADSWEVVVCHANVIRCAGRTVGRLVLPGPCGDRMPSCNCGSWAPGPSQASPRGQDGDGGSYI